MSEEPDFEMEVVKNHSAVSQSPDSSGGRSGESTSTVSLENLPEIERVPDDWRLTTVSEVAETVLGGGTPSKSEEEYWGGEIPWASVKDLDGMKANDTEDYITEEGVENSATNLIPSGSVVISTRMTVGEAFMNLVDMAINQDLKAIRPDQSEVDTHFLTYALRSKDRYLKSLGRGTTVSGITTADLQRTHLALPPLPEQRKIASVLSAVDQAIQKTEAIIEQAQRVKRGLMQDLFTEGYYQHEDFQSVKVGAREKEIPVEWKVRTVGEISKVKTGHNFSSDIFGEYGLPLIKISNIKDGFVEEEGGQDYLLETDVPEQYLLHENEVLIALSGATTGKTGVIRSDLCPAALNQRVASIVSHSVVQDYLNQYLLRNEISKFIRANASASAQKNISKGFVESIKVPVPPQDEQLKIAETLNSVQSTISAENQMVQRLEWLKKGLMQDLLTGEVHTADKAIDVLDEVVEHG